jgi:hypothetical protein
MLNVCGVATIILVNLDLMVMGGKDTEFFSFISKKGKSRHLTK